MKKKMLTNSANCCVSHLKSSICECKSGNSLLVVVSVGILLFSDLFNTSRNSTCKKTEERLPKGFDMGFYTFKLYFLAF